MIRTLGDLRTLEQVFALKSKSQNELIIISYRLVQTQNLYYL